METRGEDDYSMTSLYQFPSKVIMACPSRKIRRVCILVQNPDVHHAHHRLSEATTCLTLAIIRFTLKQRIPFAAKRRPNALSDEHDQ